MNNGDGFSGRSRKAMMAALVGNESAHLYKWVVTNATSDCVTGVWLLGG